jgi:hypothetical protein
MAYTLWHCGVKIGETDFEDERTRARRHGDSGRQRAGVFRPTPYGLELFPRMSGMLTASSELREIMRERGLPDDPDTEAAWELFETTEPGKKIIDIGRVLCDVTVRDRRGVTLPFASISFMDLTELEVLTRKMNCRSDDFEVAALDPRAPRYVVSATFRLVPRRSHGRRTPH